jgi:hypothetical protein
MMSCICNGSEMIGHTFKVIPSMMKSIHLSSKEIFTSTPDLNEALGNAYLQDIISIEADAIRSILELDDKDNYITLSMTESEDRSMAHPMRDILEIDRCMTSSPLLYRDLYCHMFFDDKGYVSHIYTWVEKVADDRMMCMSLPCYCPALRRLEWSLVDVMFDHITLFRLKEGIDVMTIRETSGDLPKTFLERYHQRK